MPRRRQLCFGTPEKLSLRAEVSRTIVEKAKKKPNIILWVVLHLMLAIYSLSGVFTKLAGTQEFLSPKFILYYGAVLVILGIYAIGWQQIIKRMPLTAAYANKAIGFLWACVYGILFFNEQITIGKIIGGAIVAAGVILFATAGDNEEPKSSPEANEGGEVDFAAESIELPAEDTEEGGDV